MTGVETIARIRFEHYQNGKGIKRITRELGIARDTVRKVLRSGATEFSYKRAVQPQPKLGEWVPVLTEILEGEAKLPKRERRSTQRLFEELRGRGYDGAHDSVHRFVKAWRRAVAHGGAGLRAAAVRSGRGLPVRLESRDDRVRGSAADGQGRADAADLQPHADRARLLPRDPGDGVRRARTYCPGTRCPVNAARILPLQRMAMQELKPRPHRRGFFLSAWDHRGKGPFSRHDR
jgi:hypothetical protein